MALTFIGKGPDKLPLPPGIEYDPKRFVGSHAPPEKSPCTPSHVKIRYLVTDKEGRIKTEYADIDPIPEGCTVKELISLIHEFGPNRLQQLSIRSPVELRYLGQPLGFEKRLDAYAIKNGSELQVVVKPKLADYAALAAGDSQITRVRIVSHKLAMPTILDGLTPETTVLDLKKQLNEKFKANPSWLVRGPVPPVAAGPRPPVQIQMTDGSMVELRVGDHLIKDGGAAAGGGGKDKKGAGGMLKRISDGVLVEQAKADPELWMITLDLENDKWLHLFHQGCEPRRSKLCCRRLACVCPTALCM